LLGQLKNHRGTDLSGGLIEFRTGFSLKGSPQFLFAFNALEQGFKIPFSETGSSFPLNNFNENGWAVNHRFGKQL